MTEPSSVNGQGRFSTEFHENHGKNISLKNGKQTAERIASYNQGLVFSARPLPRNHLFQVKIGRINSKWTASLVIGVIGFPPDKWTPPFSALNIKKPSWLFHSDSVYQCGVKVKENCSTNLDSLTEGQTVGVRIDSDSTLRLVVDGSDSGTIVRELPSACYAVVDLYGQCEQVTVVDCDREVPASLPVPSSEDREKADKEDGPKEKQSLRQMEPDVIVLPNCEFQNTCSRFKATLGLPEAYFTPENSFCYCEACAKLHGDVLYGRKGDPPKDYALPIGWCKFNLRMQLKADGQNLADKWHVGFHGTKPGVVRKLLDSGDLLVSSKSLVGGVTSRLQIGHFDEKNKPEEQLDIQPIVLSPTVRYAGCQAFAPTQEYRDPKTKKTHHVRVAVQVCIKPGSYKIGPPSIGTNEQFDPKFNNNEVEWSTKERGATALCALLIKAE